MQGNGNDNSKNISKINLSFKRPNLREINNQQKSFQANSNNRILNSTANTNLGDKNNNKSSSLKPETHRRMNSTKELNCDQPLSPTEAIERYPNQLTMYEKGEILEYQEIYFVSLVKKNHPNFSDKEKYYRVIIKDHIAYRYEIIEYIGKGSFGQALKCFDHKEKKVVALKILKSKKKLYKQGMVEANILKFIKDNDPGNKTHIIRIIEHFIFRGHIMITTELLSINLYNFLENNNFHGISLGLIKRFATQLIEALCFLRKHQIVHCDLKPENILLEKMNKSAIKLIDFGSSCFTKKQIYTYIQSRFYRAPEIMLGIPYTPAIDMWSLGCILVELYTGMPIFPGENEHEQMSMIMELIGIPPMGVLQYAARRSFFFDKNGSAFVTLSPNGRVRKLRHKRIGNVLLFNNTEFISFLKACFIWEPEKRMGPDEAKLHPWLNSNSTTHKNIKNMNKPKYDVNINFYKSG